MAKKKTKKNITLAAARSSVSAACSLCMLEEEAEKAGQATFPVIQPGTMPSLLFVCVCIIYKPSIFSPLLWTFYATRHSTLPFYICTTTWHALWHAFWLCTLCFQNRQAGGGLSDLFHLSLKNKNRQNRHPYCTSSRWHTTWDSAILLPIPAHTSLLHFGAELAFWSASCTKHFALCALPLLPHMYYMPCHTTRPAPACLCTLPFDFCPTCLLVACF